MADCAVEVELDFDKKQAALAVYRFITSEFLYILYNCLDIYNK